MSWWRNLLGSRETAHEDVGGDLITSQRVEMHKRGRFNPLRGLTPRRLAVMLDAFDLGYLRDFGLTAAKMLERDDMLKTVAPKREKDASRCPWDIACEETDGDEARRKLAADQKEALTWFYNNLTATDAMDEDVRGGAKRLFRQMMGAVGMGKQVHEIVWRPRMTEAGPRLSAEFRAAPLWFFEQRTSRLRYLATEHALEGVEMEEGKWMVTVGEGLMPASAILYMFKHLPLKDLLSYSERFGLPYVLGKSRSSKGTKAWEAMVEAVRSFIGDGGAVVSEGEVIELVTATMQGEMPQKVLVELCNRAMAMLWRGGDLSTMSQDQDAVGAHAQEEESDALVEEDCGMISETLNGYVDRVVLNWAFGEGTEQLAYFVLRPPTRQNLDLEMKIDNHLLGLGARLSRQEVLERYGRTEAAEDDGETEVFARAPQTTVPPDPDPASGTGPKPKPEEEEDEVANEAGERVARALGVPAPWVLPISDLLAELESRAADGELTEREVLDLLEEARARLPELFEEMDFDELAGVIEAGLGRAALEGLREAVKQHREAK